MKKLYWVLLFSSVAALVTMITITVTGKPKEQIANEQTTQASDTPKKDSIPNTTKTGSSGEYVDYNQSEFENTNGVRLLFFHAPWCPECRALDASIQDSSIPEGVTIFKVDYDSNQTLRQKYDVRVQTTVVRVDESGNALGSFVAYGSDKHNLQAVLSNLEV